MSIRTPGRTAAAEHHHARQVFPTASSVYATGVFATGVYAFQFLGTGISIDSPGGKSIGRPSLAWFNS